MEPRIQYAQTKDGVSIAFWTLGEGMPFVHMPRHPFSHIELEWQFAEIRGWYERLAEKRMLVRYDGRGSGLSERKVADYSLDALVLDLEAVVDRLHLESFVVSGLHRSGPVAIAYAARHPERVSHLLLWCAHARTSDILQSPQAQGVVALMDKDWGLFTETVAHVLMGWSEGEPARRFAALMRESITQEAMRAAYDSILQFDVTALLPQVRSPTLILHRRQIPYPEVEIARGLASGIPDARLALLEGTSLAPYLGDMEAVVSAIDEFLGEGEEATAEPAPSGLVTILFTDIEGSTTLTQRLGDAKAQEVLRTHNTIVRDALNAHSGSEIKHTGDGIMASFSTASGALECAVAIQRGVAAHVEQHPDAPLGVYIGLNAGEPISEEKDLFGTSVDLARRICDNAQPGQILVSDLVAGLAAGKGFVFEDQGEASLKGFDRPVRLYEVRWRES
jgi:class 3 adenylate cyclase